MKQVQHSLSLHPPGQDQNTPRRSGTGFGFTREFAAGACPEHPPKPPKKGVTRIKAKGAAIATAASLGTPFAFAAKWLGDGQLLIVVTNGPADKALKAYRKRWQIECLFGDSKTRGLNMEDTRLTQPVKLNTLLVIITDRR